MKYCKKCGMLLEDSNEYCIGCGTDMTIPENVSDYPPEMAEEIEKEKDESFERNKMIMTIVGVFLVIIILAILLIFRLSQSGYEIEAPEETVEEIESEDSEDEEFLDENYENLEDYEEISDADEMTEDSIDAQGEAMTPLDGSSEEGIQVASDTDLVDMNEMYPAENTEDVQSESDISEASNEENAAPSEDVTLVETSQDDAAGNTIFKTRYPETFTKPSGSVTNSENSSRFIEKISFNMSNADGTAVLTYISPQQFWYRNSRNGQTRSNETDSENYKAYFKFENGVEPYIEAIIKTGNPSIKNLQLVSKESYSGAVDDKLSKLSKDFQSELNTGALGDYGSIGSDTQYAYMGSETGAYIYKYEALSGSTQVYFDFYAPFVANKFDYSTEANNDTGELTEWILLEFIGFQAGSKEIHDKYYNSYKTFIKESKITREMLFDENKYYEEIKEARANNTYPEPLSKAKLSSYHSSYSDSESLGTFYQNLYDLINAK